jgi:hypothetical protein
MRMGARASTAMIALLALITGAGLIAATPAPRREGATLSWVRQPTAARCPAVDVVTAAVDARLGRDHRHAGSPLLIEALVSRENSRWIARMTLYDGAGERVGQRAIASASRDCGSLVDAASLAIALAIDPTAVLQRMDASTADADAADADHFADADVIEAAVTDAAMDAHDSAPTEDVRVAVAAPDAMSSPTHTGPMSHGSVRLSGAIGALPTPAAGAELAFSTQWNRWFSTEISAAFFAEQPALNGAISVGMSQLGLAGCAGAGLGRLQLDGCVRFTGGLLHAYALAAPDVRPVAPGSTPWLSVGPSARGSITVWGPLRVDLELGALIGVVRPGFELGGSVVQRWQPWPVTVQGAVGLGF